MAMDGLGMLGLGPRSCWFELCFQQFCWLEQLRYAIAMSFVGRPKDQMLPYIKSMQAAAKMANNADLLMVMQKSDSKHMTAPCQCMVSLVPDLAM